MSTTNPQAPRDVLYKQYNKQAGYVVPICNQIYSVDVPIAQGLRCLCTMPQIWNATIHYAYTFGKQTQKTVREVGCKNLYNTIHSLGMLEVRNWAVAHQWRV